MSRFSDDYQLEGDLDYASLTRRFEWRIPDRVNIGGEILTAWEGETERIAIHAPGKGTGGTWSFDRLIKLAKRYGRLFGEVGIERGDRVGIVMPQSAEAAAVHLAIYAIGAIALPMSGLYGPDSYRFILADSGAVAVVVDARQAPKMRSVRDQLPGLRYLILHGEAASDEVPLAEAGRMPPELEPVDTAASDPALLLYTSGSTGHPKGVLHSHSILEGYLLTFRLFFGVDFEESTVFYTPSDWAWVGGLLDILLPALLLGYPVVAHDERFSAEQTWRIIEDYRVTHAFLTPTALKMLAQVPSPRERFDLNLRVIASGGESVAGDLYRWAAEDVGAVINEFYGLTEVNHLAGGSSTLWPSRPGSMGLPYPGRQVAVIDDSGEPVAPDVLGEIAVRPGDPTQMIRYWNNDKATKDRLRNGWITTGDLARTDEDGYLYFEGRRDDMISSAGYRIGPNEVEETLLPHPAVAEVAVIGSPDELRGQVVKALVIARDGLHPDDALVSELQTLVKSRLAAYKYPRVIEFVTELPKTTTGKINRRLLAQWEREAE